MARLGVVHGIVDICRGAVAEFRAMTTTYSGNGPEPKPKGTGVRSRFPKPADFEPSPTWPKGHRWHGQPGRCQAWNPKHGRQCMGKAVKGKRVCTLDGAYGGAPIKTGRYSVEHRKSLQEKVAKFWADNKPGDLRDELFLLRALLEDYIGRFPDGVAMKYEDIARVYEMVQAIAQTVERISRILNQTALTVADLQFIERRIPDLLVEFIDDPNRRLEFLEKLGRDLGSVRQRADALAVAAVAGE